MPLPPALAAKLAKRGLVNDSALRNTQEKRQKTDIEEEVIAENYDSNYKSSGNNYGDEITSVQVDKHFKGHSGCPNKWNIYHECTGFCARHWGKGIITPDAKYLRKQARLLTKYPLPNNWKEVYDPGTGKHYYWELSSDMVSWLPPGHPKANITESAATIREERHLVATDADKSGDESESGEEEEEDTVAPGTKDKVIENKRKEPRAKSKTNDLDPMDPAAYSDAPRGKWSDGLERGNEAKTGADVTASGPLYQMRPYPNPGAVLRANAATKPSST